MSATPSVRDKRPLESPGTPSPIHKQIKMADCSQNTSELNLHSHESLSMDDRMNNIMEVLLAVKRGQESLQKTFDSKIDKLRKDVMATIDDKIKAVKVDLDLEFASLDNRIVQLERALSSLSTDGMPLSDHTVNNCDVTVIVSNLRKRPSEIPLDVAKELVRALGDDIFCNTSITDVKRCDERAHGKPPVHKIAFESVEQKVNVLRDDNRLTKCVFNSDYTATGKTWCLDMKNLLHQVNMQQSFENKQIVNLEHVKKLFNNKHQQEWNEKLHTVSKLRTYVTFKSNYETETYLKLNICKAERSHLAQFRCAVLPLKIETGRFLGLNVEDRLCQVCDQNAVENEIHFLLHCTLYDDLRRAMIVKSDRRDIGFRTLTETEKLTFILKHEERQCAKFIFSAMQRRKSVLYR